MCLFRRYLIYLYIVYGGISMNNSVLYKNTNIRIVFTIQSCVGVESASTLLTQLCMGIASPSHIIYLTAIWTLCYRCVTADKVILYLGTLWFLFRFLLSLRVVTSKRWKSLVLEDEVLKFTSKISLETCILLTVQSLQRGHSRNNPYDLLKP